MQPPAFLLEIGLEHYLFTSLVVFLCGLFTVLTRRNAIGVLMGVELILNAANIDYIAFARFSGNAVDGQIFSIFIQMFASSSPRKRKWHERRKFLVMQTKIAQEKRLL